MTKHNLINIGVPLLLIIFLNACNGQIKNNPSNEQKKISTTEKVGHLKFKTSHWAKATDNILASIIDSKGNLWFGTSGGGVYNYDGKLFKQYTINDGLSHNNVCAIYEDTKGIIWLGTSDGITTWDGNTFTKISTTTLRSTNAKPYKATTIDSIYGVVSQENEINDIMQDNKGHFWFAAYKAIYRYDGLVFTNHTVNDGVKNNTDIAFEWIERIMEDKAGKIWFGGRGTAGLFSFDGKTLINHKDWQKKSNSSFLTPRIKDNNGDIWFSNWEGLYCYKNRNFESFTAKEGLCAGSAFDGIKDKAGNLWFAMENRKNGCGICKYDGNSFQYFPILIGPTNKFSNAIVEDNNGNLWVGVTGGELYRFDGKKFKLYSE
jgi:ligand-binding sensor domain-containing protein